MSNHRVKRKKARKRAYNKRAKRRLNEALRALATLSSCGYKRADKNLQNFFLAYGRMPTPKAKEFLASLDGMDPSEVKAAAVPEDVPTVDLVATMGILLLKKDPLAMRVQEKIRAGNNANALTC